MVIMIKCSIFIPQSSIDRTAVYLVLNTGDGDGGTGVSCGKWTKYTKVCYSLSLLYMQRK